MAICYKDLRAVDLPSIDSDSASTLADCDTFLAGLCTEVADSVETVTDVFTSIFDAAVPDTAHDYANRAISEIENRHKAELSQRSVWVSEMAGDSLPVRRAMLITEPSDAGQGEGRDSDSKRTSARLRQEAPPKGPSLDSLEGRKTGRKRPAEPDTEAADPAQDNAHLPRTRLMLISSQKLSDKNSAVPPFTVESFKKAIQKLWPHLELEDIFVLEITQALQRGHLKGYFDVPINADSFRQIQRIASNKGIIRLAKLREDEGPGSPPPGEGSILVHEDWLSFTREGQRVVAVEAAKRLLRKLEFTWMLDAADVGPLGRAPI